MTNRRALFIGLVLAGAATACSQDRIIRVVGPSSDVGVGLENRIFFFLSSCASVDGIFCEDATVLSSSDMTIDLIEGSIDYVKPLVETETMLLTATIVATVPGPIRFRVTTPQLGDVEIAIEAREVRSSFLELSSGRLDPVGFRTAHTNATRAKVFANSRALVSQYHFDTELDSWFDAAAGQRLSGETGIRQASGEDAFTISDGPLLYELETQQVVGEGRLETSLGQLDIEVVDINDVATIELREALLEPGEQDVIRIERGDSAFVEIVALAEDDLVIEGEGALFEYDVFQSNLILSVIRREFGARLQLIGDTPGTTQLNVSLGEVSATLTVIVE